MTSFPFIANEITDEDGNVTYDRAESVSSRRNLNQLDRTEGVDIKNPNAFLVLAGTGMTVIVTGSTGTTIESQAWAQVAGTMANEEEESRTLAIEASDTLDRIDRVVLRKDDADEARDVDLYIVKGTPAASPIAPELTRNTTVWEIALADVFVPKNSTAVSQSYITDQRLNDEVCGQMGSYFDNPDFSPYFLQISALIADYQADTTQSLADLQAAIDSIVAGSSTMLKEEYAGSADGVVAQADNATNATNGIQTYTHSTSVDDDGNTVHSLEGEGVNGKFIAATAFTAGDTFVLNGEAILAITPSGDSLTTACFAEGATVQFAVTEENITVYVRQKEMKVVSVSGSNVSITSGAMSSISATLGTAYTSEGWTVAGVVGHSYTSSTSGWTNTTFVLYTNFSGNVGRTYIRNNSSSTITYTSIVFQFLIQR